MTDNNPNDTDKTEDDADSSTGRDVIITVAGEEAEYSAVEWGVDPDEEIPNVSPQDFSRELTGTITFEGPVDEIEGDVTIIDAEGNETRIENATIKSREKVREEARKLRENAPAEQRLGERTTDIDDVIKALHKAKERGIDEVYVNDDRMTRRPDPRITNNHVHYLGTGPKPGDLEEWVEL